MIKIMPSKNLGVKQAIATNQQIIDLIRTRYMDDVLGILESTVQFLRRMTPRSDRSQPEILTDTLSGQKWHTGHLADGWRVYTLGGEKAQAKGRRNARVLATIYNELTHTPSGRVKPSARCRNRYRNRVYDYSVLEVLEYGSRQHIVVPVRKGIRALHFFMGNKEVFATMSAPRGIRPRGFVRAAREYLQRQLGLFNANMVRRIRETMVATRRS